MKEKLTEKKKLLYYVILAVSVLLLTAATVLTVYFVVGDKNHTIDNGGNTQNPDGDGDGDDNPSGGGDTVEFVNPMETMTVSVKFGFHHNQTLGWYYDHEGVDLKAEEGTEVVSMSEGTVESITTDELTGTQIIIDHGDGLKTLYRYV